MNKESLLGRLNEIEKGINQFATHLSTLAGAKNEILFWLGKFEEAQEAKKAEESEKEPVVKSPVES